MSQAYLMQLRHKKWDAKRAYAGQFGIGPAVIKVLIKYPYSGGV